MKTPTSFEREHGNVCDTQTSPASGRPALILARYGPSLTSRTTPTTWYTIENAARMIPVQAWAVP